MDPLSLVRQFTIDHTPVNYVDGYYIFGKHRFHESTRTAFKRTHKSGGYYTLRDVIFYLENANLQISEYRAKVNAAGVTAIVVLDSPNLMAYLTGKIDTCEQIDHAYINSGPIEQLGGIVSTENNKLSVEKMNEQRQHFAAYLDELVQQTNLSKTKIESLPRFTLESDFIKTDQSQLVSLRADEYAATNRTMVLVKPGSDFGFALQSFNDHVLKDLVNNPANSKQSQINNPDSEKKLQSTPTPTSTSTSNHHPNSHPNSNNHNHNNNNHHHHHQQQQHNNNNNSRSVPPSVSSSAPSTPASSSSSNIPGSLRKRPNESLSSSQTPISQDPNNGHHKVMKTSHSSDNSSQVVGIPGMIIILVPSAVTSVLCNLNCIDFLKDSRYISVDEKRRLGARREAEMRFEHTTSTGKRLVVRVLDSGTKLNDREWANVIAVFVQGAEWQFKQWKWSSPVELFHKVLGFYFMLDDREVDPKILSWNCKVLKINSSKRHLDASAYNEFWLSIEEYIRISKPWILGGSIGNGSSRGGR